MPAAPTVLKAKIYYISLKPLAETTFSINKFTIFFCHMLFWFSFSCFSGSVVVVGGISFYPCVSIFSVVVLESIVIKSIE